MVMQRLTSRVRNIFQMGNANSLITPVDWVEDPIGLYQLLEAYYHSNDLYSQAARVAFDAGKWLPEMKALRNPAHRVVEFYVAHLFPPEFVLEGPNTAAIQKPIEQVWKASNWEAKQRLAARRFAMHGDLFIKVGAPEKLDGTPRAVQFQILNARHVLDFDADDRGFLTYCYIEVPSKIVRIGDEITRVWHTEIWDLTSGTYRQWESDQHKPIEQLGTPRVTSTLAELGIDFIPIVHAMFKDVGNPRGESAFGYAMEKIDEANLMVTRLHRMLYRNNDVTWALRANGVSPTGQALPPVNVRGAQATADDTEANIIVMNGETFLALPGTSILDSLVPTLNYEAALSIVNAQVDELERDLPELAFHRIRENGEISGRAARMMLTDAIDKATEARANVMQALIRANQMALTIGGGLGVEGFPTDAGAFDAGALEHTYEARDIIPEDEHDHWETEKLKAETAEAMQRSGIPVGETLRLRGYDETEVARLLAERDEEKAAAAERAAQMFDAGDDGGGDDDQPSAGPPANRGSR